MRLRALTNLLRPRDEWVIALMGAFMLFIAFNTQTGWLYLVVAILVALLAIGFVGPRLTLRGLEVSRLPIAPAWEGDVVKVRLRVRNPSRWARHVLVASERSPFPVEGQPVQSPYAEEPIPDAATNVRFAIGTVPPRGGVTLEYAVRCAWRGAFPLGEVTLGCATPLGFFPKARRFHVPGEIVVYPRGPALSWFDASRVAPRASGGGAVFSRVGHSYDLRGVRPYLMGDDIRFVHWPTTARAGQLMTREFHDAGAQRLTIVIDASAVSGDGTPGATPLDDAARLAASLTAQARATGARVTLAAARAEEGVRRLPDARGEEALDWLARLRATDAPPWSEVAVVAVQGAPRGVTIVLAASPIEPEAARALVFEVSPLFVVLIEANDGNGALDRSADALAVAGARVWRHRCGRDVADVFTEARGAAV